MTLSGGGQRCRDDITVHLLCDVPCGVKLPMNDGDAYLLA